MDTDVATKTLERLRRHQQRLSPQTELSSIIHNYCSFLEAILDDIVNGHITGPAVNTEEILGGAIKVCDLLDNFSEEAWASAEMMTTTRQ